MRMTALMLVLASALVACSPQGSTPAAAPGASQAVHAESGLAVIPLSVTGKGGNHAFRVELAESAMDQQKGLMFRTAMGSDEGMLFPMNPPRFASFWMKNTVLSLDLLFVGPDGRILNIAANAVPYSESHLESIGPVKAVLEINGGRAAQLGIVAGDTVRW